MRKILEECPSCAGDMVVTQLSCRECDTVVLGHFAPTIFARLAPDDLDLIVQFVRHKGNVKEMERDSGVSYWTIRNRLNDIVARLGLDDARPDEAAVAAERHTILQQLDEGLIGPADAAARLAALSEKE